MNQLPHRSPILELERPDRSLWTYYLLSCLAIPPLFPFLVLPMWFRYQTMRYQFTDEGLSMRWGILFRREIIINYARIQDIHLRSNILERWLGLARVMIQTASGNAGAEMTLEGFKEYEAVRDFLYSKMRGVKEPAAPSAQPSLAHSSPDTDLAAALREVAHELRETRVALQSRPSSANDSSHV